MRSALKGLVLELKGISCTLPVFCLETGPSPDPHCWINAQHFLRSAHPAGQNHFSCVFFPEEWEVSIYSKMIQHWCNILTGNMVQVSGGSFEL